MDESPADQVVGRAATPRVQRRRVKGKWSGAEAKYAFLSSHMVDSPGLESRLHSLDASPWSQWLADEAVHTDGHMTTYTCPTYVLYDALSAEGRGERGGRGSATCVSGTRARRRARCLCVPSPASQSKRRPIQPSPCVPTRNRGGAPLSHA